ncbi:MAG: GH116 family glycosyl hydrolase [Phycisphaerae bacterium]
MSKKSGCYALVIILIATMAGVKAIGAESFILHDERNKTVEIQGADKALKLRVNYGSGCFIDRLFVDGKQILHEDNGISSAVKINNYWHLSKDESKSVSVQTVAGSVVVRNISYGTEDFRISEDWTFSAVNGSLDWSISRTIPSDKLVDAAANSHWEFASMDTWTGAILDNGAVAWSKLLPTSFYTFGNHAAEALFWNKANGLCFEVKPTGLNGRKMASRFTRSPRDTLIFAQALTDEPVETRVNLSRCLDNDAIWKPLYLRKGTQTMSYRLSLSQLQERFDLGDFKGIDEDAVREILNTIVRYGVIDSNLCGANGWRSGYICLHEQWYAQMAMAIQDEDYTRNLSDTYDNFRDNAVLEDGRVLARFKDNGVDAMPGTYTAHGLYEAQWGRLLDSQCDYVMVVSEQFHNTGDLDWVRGQKRACEAALDYMLRRDSDGDGLLEMETDSHTAARGSDWIDIIWASHENALVNAEMYGAMQLWSDIEEILGDSDRAALYREAAAKLKERFNQSVEEGGFWNPEQNWYVYWRDKDDSIHGDNLVIPVNFCAIGYELCDDESRAARLLAGLETAMEKENLFAWPLCVYPYEEGEGAGSNYPFPRYENGDIFLSWAELGTRAYASYKPEIAMKYISRIIGQYGRDGLTFQRYARRSQEGLGDDILAGNGMAVVGLYRNLFGIRPQYNRLYLAPHMTAAVEGTSVKYRLRGKDYLLEPAITRSKVTVDDFSVIAAGDFGVSSERDRLSFFRGSSRAPSLLLERLRHCNLRADISAAGDFLRWSLSADADTEIKLTLCGLTPEAGYILNDDGSATEIKAGKDGRMVFSTEMVSGERKLFSVSQGD